MNRDKPARCHADGPLFCVVHHDWAIRGEEISPSCGPDCYLDEGIMAPSRCVRHQHHSGDCNFKTSRQIEAAWVQKRRNEERQY